MIEKLEECILLSKQQNEYIKVIKEGVESLKEHYRIACEYNEIADKKIEELNNIINEIERYINEKYIYDELGMKIFDASKLQDKLQELKGSE